jgi:tRNA(Ile)-lysidine synthase
LRQVAEAAEDANPEVTWEGGVFRRYRDYLYLCQPAPQLPDTTALQPWDLNEPFFVGNSLVLTARLTDKPGLCLKSGDRVEVGFRRGGERCKPLGRNHSAPLKKILQEYGVEPWLRALVPLVYVNGELAALAGYFVCDGFSGISGDRCYQLDWNIN